MKKIAILGAALLAFAACSRENVNTEPVGKEITLCASMPDTKAKVDDSGIFTWQEGDKIGVFVVGSDTPVPFTLSEGAGETTAKFTGTVSDELAGYAVYPYDAATTLSGTTLSVNMTHLYDYNNMKASAVMLAKNVEEGSSFTFEQLGGLVKVVLNEVPSNAKYFRFISTGATTVSGRSLVDVSKEGDELKLASPTGGEYGSRMSVTIPNDNTPKGKMSFYVPLAPGDYTFQIRFLTSGYKEINRVSKNRTTAYTIEKGKLYLLPEIRFPGLFTFENSDDIHSYYNVSNIVGKYANLSVTDNPSKDIVNSSDRALKLDLSGDASSTSGFFQFNNPWTSGSCSYITIKVFMGNNDYFPYLLVSNKRRLPVQIDGVAVEIDDSKPIVDDDDARKEDGCKTLLWGENKNKWHLLRYDASDFDIDNFFGNVGGAKSTYQFRPLSVANADPAPAATSETNNKVVYYDDFELLQIPG